MRGRLLAAAMLVLWSSPGLAHVAGTVVPGYVHSVWTTQQGLPQSGVLALLQTRDGYLWIGTGNGLVRFDGVTLRVFDVTTTPALPTGWISALYEDADGVLWIGTGGGLVRYHDGSFTRQRLDDDGDLHVYSIQQDRQGRLWVATGRRVLQRRAGGWHAIALGDVRVRGLVVDREGVLWIGTDTGLIQWRDRTLRVFTAADGLPDDSVQPLRQDRAGNLWIRRWGGDARGLVRLDTKSGDVEPAPGALAEAFVNAAFEGEDGRIWFGARASLYALDRRDRVTAYPMREGSRNSQVLALTWDREGNLWFGVSGGRGGLHRLSPQRVALLPREQGLPCRNFSAVTQGPDGTVWAGLHCKGGPGLVAIRNGEIASYGDAGGVAPELVTALLALPEGDLWVGSYEGRLFHLEDGRFTRYTAKNSGLATYHYISALHRDAQGALWIGSEAGLNRLYRGRWTTYTTRDGLAHDHVHWITDDPEGALWIGTSGGVSRYSEGRFTNFTDDDGLPRARVRTVHVDEDGVAWIGTYGGGLARLADGEITSFGTREGLLDNSVHRILEDDRGFLWLSGDRGIRRVSREGLNAVAAGRSTRLSVDIFDQRDGMKSAEANGMGQPAGWKMRDGSLWFPTQDGIVRIDPEAVRRATVPLSPVIEEVTVDGTAHDPHRAIRVPPGADELEIHYTAPAFTRPEQIRFRYRLAGHDSRWIEAGPRRVAHYANLSPGAYRFELAARGVAGLWSDERATLALTLEPRFYQRPSARLGALLLLAAAIYAAVRLRLLRLRRRAVALEATVAERTAELRREREGLELANRRLGEANERVRRAKEVLEASHTHLLSVLAQLSIGVLVVDEQERVLFSSEATERLLGGASGEAVGRTLEEVLPIPAATLAEVREQLPAPRSGVRTAARLEPRPDRHYWAEIEVSTDPRDERHRILYLYDVTEAYDLGRRRATAGDGALGRLLGVSPAIRRVHSHILTVAGVDATVLIEGETGTGKELVARAIHEASERRRRSFVAVNCAGLTESLLASQLFGHRRGAFTGAVADHVGLFEAAQGGTLLLDEIGDMPIAMQTHLLRVLQEREIIRVGDTRPRPIDVRVLASTHRDLEQEVEEGRFREDLLYRIRVARIPVPSLRQRPEDIPQLAAAFLSAHATQDGKVLNGFGREAMELLRDHTWPGNVRELKSVVEWAAIHAAGPVIKRCDLPPELADDGVPPPAPRAPKPEAERQLLLETLRRTGGDRTAAARLLGIGRSTLYRRLAALKKATSEGGASDPPDSGT